MRNTKRFRTKVLDDQILSLLMMANNDYEEGYIMSYTYVYNADALVTYAYYCGDIDHIMWLSMHTQLLCLAEFYGRDQIVNKERYEKG